MFGDRVVCTAVDLVRAARCEFALLRALDRQLGTLADGFEVIDPAGPEPPVPYGDSREPAELRLAELRDRFAGAMVEIRPAPPSADPAARVAALRAAHTETVAALRTGVHVVRGATFFDGRFAADCEFLVRAGHRVRYTAQGSAPGSADRVGAALELAACAAGLEHAGALTAPMVRLYLGDVATDYPLDDLLPIHRTRRRRVERILEEKLSELLPAQWGDRRYLACGRCRECVTAIENARDLYLVAGMGNSARARLRAAGVHTIERLAAKAEPVSGLSPRTFAALRRQAEIQLRDTESATPAHTLIDAIALGALPPASPGDLALTVTGEVVEVGASDGVRLAVRAGRALPAVLDLIAEQRQRHPDMHVYHYAATIRTDLLVHTASAGVGEEFLDELLRAGVLIDLYPIVRSALLVGATSYELAALRPLLPNSSPPERDCVVALRLRDWLLARAAAPRPDLPVMACAGSWCLVPGPEEPEAALPQRPSSVEAALTEFVTVQTNPRQEHHPAAVTAAALGYHRRERRPLWLAHIDRLGHPVDEWVDAPGVLVAEWGTVDTKWHRAPHRQTMRRYLTLTGRIGTGGETQQALAPGATVHTFYDRPAAAGMVTAIGRRATATATVLGCSVDAEFDDVVRLEELLPEGCEPYDELPIAIAPGLPAWDANTEGAVEYAAQQLLAALPDIPYTALFDIIALRRPRLRRALSLPEVHGDHAAAITAAVRDLDESYLAVQGPSGTGKTATAARIVERLVTRDKWRIGVVARTHKAVEHLLDAVVRIGVLPELVAKLEAEAVKPEWLVIEAARVPRFLDNCVNGCVIGGLPTDFADETIVPAGRLDLLVVADAGGFPLADTAAVAVSARNLLLLGDLAPDTARATHPQPVGRSVLNWLAQGRATLPTELGYFLDRTWRMHPKVCEPISRLFYEHRLRSNETVTLARHLDGVAPGIETVLVDHHGNGAESEAEAREVVRRVRALLGAAWTIGAVTRRLHPHDIFVVAPYPAQVGLIRILLARAKIEDVLVGTADRFRGREAAVVLVSMTTSSPADAPHGMPALLSNALLRAALSRAMWKAIIIRSPLLTEYLPPHTDELADLAGFLTLS
nr:AAA domain-containing protein [Nocardia panacis]